MKNETAFDSVAQSYDDSFTFSEAGKLQRQRVCYFLKKYLPENRKLQILEVNCGTGEDAIWLASQGHDVIATDASEKMIAISNPKSQIPNLKFKICAFKDIAHTYENEKFDLIFSNFGGLNCVDEAELKKLSSDFSSLLKTDGKFIAVVMGRKCLWEILYFLLKFNFKKAFRRNSPKGIDAVVGTGFQKTFYYSPVEFGNNFSRHFKVVCYRPVGITLPPSYLESFFKNKKWFLDLLNFIERLLPFSFLSNLADHYFIVLENKS